MPKYTTSIPNSDKSNKIFAKGKYPFFVRDAGDKKSSSGNWMIELQIVAKNRSAETTLIYDHLVFIETATWKVDDFRIATGEKLEPGVESSLEANECIGRKGWLTLGVENYQGRLKNKVEGYLKPEDAPPSTDTPSQAATAPKNPMPAIDGVEAEPDDIPF